MTWVHTFHKNSLSHIFMVYTFSLSVLKEVLNEDRKPKLEILTEFSKMGYALT